MSGGCGPERVLVRTARKGKGPVERSVVCSCGTQTGWRASDKALAALYARHLADKAAGK